MAEPRRINDVDAIYIEIPLDHPQVTATTTWAMYEVPVGFVGLAVIGAYYVNHVGLAENATNAFDFALMNGATVVANGIDTDSDAAGADNSLVALTPVAFTLAAAAADRLLAPGDVLTAVATEDGAATLPPGRFVVRGYLI